MAVISTIGENNFCSSPDMRVDIMGKYNMYETRGIVAAPKRVHIKSKGGEEQDNHFYDTHIRKFIAYSAHNSYLTP